MQIRKTIQSRLSTKGLAPEEIGLRHLAVPILLESILRTSVGLVNIAFLSRVSDSLVSSVSIANQYIAICQVIANAVAMGTIVCINQAIGMHNTSRVHRMATVAVAANTVLGLLFGLFFLLFAQPFLSIMEISADSAQTAALYMRIVGGAMVLQCVQMVMSSICRSLGKTHLPLLLNLCVNAVNIAGCALVIFAPVPWPFAPATGVALVNVLSQAAGLLLSFFALRSTGVRIGLHHLRPFPWADLKLALSIGVPGGANNIAYGTSQLVTTAIISQTGEIMIAAKVYVSNLLHYVALIGMACAQAAIIMIGYRIGAGKYEEAMALRRRVTRIALVSNITCSLLLMLVRRPLLSLFTQNEAILAIAATVMCIDLFVEIGRALNNTLSGALQATGDVVYQLIVNQASGWLMAVGLAYVLGVHCALGLNGVWIAFALDEATRGLILLYRWNSRKWLPKAIKRRNAVAGGTSKA